MRPLAKTARPSYLSTSGQSEVHDMIAGSGRSCRVSWKDIDLTAARFNDGIGSMNFNERQIPPPKYWQQFEDLCLSLFRNIWGDPTAQKNGRSGRCRGALGRGGSCNRQGQPLGVSHRAHAPGVRRGRQGRVRAAGQIRHGADSPLRELLQTIDVHHSSPVPLLRAGEGGAAACAGQSGTASGHGPGL